MTSIEKEMWRMRALARKTKGLCVNGSFLALHSRLSIALSKQGDAA